MKYKLTHLVKAIDQLRKEGIDGVIIGNTCIYLMLRQSDLEDDIDLFVTSFSPLIEEERIRAIASQRGWRVGLTELGTPSLILSIEGIEVRVELYENIHDFYIPTEALNLCRRKLSLSGTDIVFVAPECWAVFKAKRGSGQDMYALSKLYELYQLGELQLDLALIKKIAQFYEDEAQYIIDRLQSIGFKF